MKSKIVTAYWMDVNGYPFQGSSDVRKPRYLGSLISHCIGSGLPVICYTHNKNYDATMKCGRCVVVTRLIDARNLRYTSSRCRLADFSAKCNDYESSGLFA